jgi:hypothetical protein
MTRTVSQYYSGSNGHRDKNPSPFGNDETRLALPEPHLNNQQSNNDSLLCQGDQGAQPASNGPRLGVEFT